jgi:hypothetical protein
MSASLGGVHFPQVRGWMPRGSDRSSKFTSADGTQNGKQVLPRFVGIDGRLL